MNKLISIIIVITFISCQGNKAANSNIKSTPIQNITKKLTEFEINEEMHNFGLLQSGEIVVYSFELTNTGKEILYFDGIETDCGCIKVEYSNDSFLPGETGIMEVEFDSSGLWGKQFKTIEIKANTKKPKQLVIFAEVQNEKLEFKY